jgi:hypothetical protein
MGIRKMVLPSQSFREGRDGKGGREGQDGKERDERTKVGEK